MREELLLFWYKPKFERYRNNAEKEIVGIRPECTKPIGRYSVYGGDEEIRLVILHRCMEPFRRKSGFLLFFTARIDLRRLDQFLTESGWRRKRT